MPMIAPQRKPERQAFTIKLDIRLLTLLKAYADCIASSQEYVVNEALLATFIADRDFRTWLDRTAPHDAAALRGILLDRPPNAVPGAAFRRRSAARVKPKQQTLDLSNADPAVEA